MWPTLLLLPLLAAPREVIIDREWLAERGKPPYLLSVAGTTYILKTDVRVDGTAFIVDAPDVVLDLNGHKVIYGDSAPVVVQNGGFEEGTGRDVPGWDLTDAPSAGVAANTTYLFGKQVLRLQGFRTTQRIVSEPILVPATRHPHAAVITPARGHYRTSLVLSVVDADTRRVLGQGKSGNVERGSSAVAFFEPGECKAVRLVVQADPPAGEAVNLDLDDARVTAAHDYGVLATNAVKKDVPGWNYLPAPGKAGRRVGHVTVKNGSVLQGQGRGLGSPPLFFAQARGVAVEWVETLTTGMDTTTLDASKVSGPVVIRNSILRHDVNNISSRFKLFSAIRLAGVGGPIQIEDNQLLRVPQVGISLSGVLSGKPVVIRHNRIQQQAVVTNGYGLLLVSTRNFEIAHNRIIADNGRGILLDSYRREPISDGRIHDNHVEVREGPNREYWSKIETRALRLRNTVDRKGPHKDVVIRDNTFVAVTGDGLAQKAFAVLISYQNADGSMNDANVRLEHNTLRAVTTSRDPASRASALAFDSYAPGVGLHVTDNILESNDCSLTLGEADGGVEELKLVGNTFRRLKEGAARPYRGIRAGQWNRVLRDVAVLGPRLENDASLDIDWQGVGRKDLALGRLLTVNVKQGEQTRAGVEVTVRDRDGREVFAGKTDENGQVRDIPLVTVRHDQRTADPKKISADERGPFRVSATADGKSVTEEILVRENSELSLQLSSR